MLFQLLSFAVIYSWFSELREIGLGDVCSCHGHWRSKLLRKFRLLPLRTSTPSGWWSFGLCEPLDYCPFGLVNCPPFIQLPTWPSVEHLHWSDAMHYSYAMPPTLPVLARNYGSVSRLFITYWYSVLFPRSDAEKKIHLCLKLWSFCILLSWQS